jgi:hypothetical protein
VNDDDKYGIRANIAGLHKRPVTGSGGCAAVVSKLIAAAAAYDDLREALGTKGQVRVQTRDDMVIVTISREDGLSIRMYGPFESADAEREFICNVYRSAPCDPKIREAYIAQTMRWRRFDEQ